MPGRASPWRKGFFYHPSNMPRCSQLAPQTLQVAWSQRPLDLPKLAKRYIQGTRGQIRTVIGVNLEYQCTAGGPASFLVWRAGQPNQGGVPSVGQPDEK